MENELIKFTKILINLYEKSNVELVKFVSESGDIKDQLYGNYIDSNNQIAQNLIADIDNIFLYFSPKGIEMWSKKQIDGLCYTTIERLKTELTKCKG